MTTGVVAFLALPVMVLCVKMFVDVSTNGPVGLALFHTLFNVTGVIIFMPLIPVMTKLLVKYIPEYKPVLSVYLDYTPTEEVDAAGIALKNEVYHLFQECQLYTLRNLGIDERLVFDHTLPFESNKKKKIPTEDIYTGIRLLHSSIISYYSRIQNNQLDEEKTRELGRVILASRNIMNATQNFKSLHPNLEEFESSDSVYLNKQYERFRKRLITLYHEIDGLFALEDPAQRYNKIMSAFQQVEDADNTFIEGTVKAAPGNHFQQMDLSTLFLANRLFTQACRMFIYSLKDLFLVQDQKVMFDKAVEK